MESLIKKLQNIMRGDDLSGTVQYLKQMIWMIFLKIYDAQEEKWELLEDDYTSIIPEELKWRNWAVDNNDGKALTGDELIKFVNDTLIMGLKKLEVNEYTPNLRCSFMLSELVLIIPLLNNKIKTYFML